MITKFTITSTLPVAAEKFGRGAIFARVADPVRMGELGLEARQLSVERLKINTPRSDGDDGKHLGDTTEASDLAIEPGPPATVSWSLMQKKTITIQGEEVPLFIVLTTGHVAPPNGIRPVFKKALFWRGLNHPVMFSRGGPSAPNPYIKVAMDELKPLINAMHVESTIAFNVKIMDAMKA